MLKAFLLFCALAASSLNGADGYAPIEEQGGLPVLTPSLAQRTTEKIRLSNGLEAYLISDPDADKSSAALAVKAGMWEEPPSHPGLAHFLEHMLFMGTEKFPDENEFDLYLSDNGGSTDAFTADDFTAFVFDVDTPALEGALDRFARFFKEPRFNPSGVARELKAIDQEFAKNVENDDNREYHIIKELSKKDHPFHLFSMGNSKTLSAVSREDLIAWYKAHYSADIMHLAVISPLPLDKLRALTVDAFAGIPNLGAARPPVTTSTVDRENLARMAYIVPVKNTRTLSIIWEVDPQFVDLDAKPDSLICLVLGDEGPGSLLANLKAAGLADTLVCGMQPITEKVQLFIVTVGLTDAGVAHADTVIEKVFQTIALLRQSGLPAYLFDDAQTIAKLQYQYQPREIPFNEAMRHAAALPYEPLSTYPVHSYVIQRFDRQLTTEMLASLKPRAAYYQLAAAPSLTGVKPTRKEQWLGAEYSLEAIPDALLDRWERAQPDAGITLPPPNPYIPHQLALVNKQAPPLKPVPTPITVRDGADGTVYFAPDTQYGLPEVVWMLYLKTPQVNPSPYKAALIDLYARYLADMLNPSNYAAAVAGLSVDISGGDYGLNIKIAGYSEKAPLLLEKVLHALKDGEVDAARFARVKKLLGEEYEDSLLEAPYEQAVEWLRAALFKTYSRPIEKAKALEKVDLERFTRFQSEVFDKVYVEGMLYGNMDEGQARKTADLLYAKLGSAPYPKGRGLENACLVMPAEGGPFMIENTTQAQGNAALLAIEDGPFDYKTRGCQQVLMQAITSPFFTTLRTQQQTGYIVTNYAIEINRELFSCLLVQSNTHNPRDLVARFELFLESFLQEIGSEGLPPERFEKIKASLIAELQKPAKNQAEMADLLYRMAFKYKGDFSRIEMRTKALEALTYGQCVEWAKAQYGTANKRRLAVGIIGKIPMDGSLDYHELSSLKQLRKLSAYNTDQP